VDRVSVLRTWSRLQQYTISTSQSTILKATVWLFGARTSPDGDCLTHRPRPLSAPAVCVDRPARQPEAAGARASRVQSQQASGTLSVVHHARTKACVLHSIRASRTAVVLSVAVWCGTESTALHPPFYATEQNENNFVARVLYAADNVTLGPGVCAA